MTNLSKESQSALIAKRTQEFLMKKKNKIQHVEADNKKVSRGFTAR
jgi:hypothetical protein